MAKKILLIEDDSLVARMLATMLDKSGFACDHVEDEHQAIAMFQQALSEGRPYEVLVVDLVLGESNRAGANVVKQIKEDYPEVVAILCTGFSSSQVALNFQDYGFDFCLKKPFSWDSLKVILSEFADYDGSRNSCTR